MYVTRISRRKQYIQYLREQKNNNNIYLYIYLYMVEQLWWVNYNFHFCGNYLFNRSHCIHGNGQNNQTFSKYLAYLHLYSLIHFSHQRLSWLLQFISWNIRDRHMHISTCNLIQYRQHTTFQHINQCVSVHDWYTPVCISLFARGKKYEVK